AAHSIALLSPRIPAALTHDALGELAVRGVGHLLEHALLEGLWPVLPLRPRAVIQELLVGTAQQARGGALLISQRAPEVADLAGHGRAERESQPDLGTHSPDPSRIAGSTGVDHRPLDRYRQAREGHTLRELEADEPRERGQRTALLEVLELELLVVDRLADHAVGMEVVHVPDRRARGGVARLQVQVMRLLLEQPELGAHVVAASEGQSARVNPRRGRAVDGLELALAVVVQLVLHAGDGIDLLVHLHQPAKDAVEPAFLDRAGDALADYAGSSRGQRERHRL